jgi:hypothetical protein
MKNLSIVLIGSSPFSRRFQSFVIIPLHTNVSYNDLGERSSLSYAQRWYYLKSV